MNETKFSLITTVHNTKKEYLRDYFSSVLNVKYENYEIIIIDNGSKQETRDYLNSYLDRCTIVFQENKGISAGRMAGLKISSGDYIVFLDSDDVLDQNAFSILNDIILKCSPDVIINDPPRFDGSIEKTISRKFWFENDGLLSKEEALIQLCMLHTPRICDKYAKRSLFKGIENKIDTSFINGEDLQQSTFLELQAESIYYTKQIIQYYRINTIHRDYYDFHNLNDMNYLTPMYKMLFEDHTEYDYLKRIFKKNAAISILFNAFRICYSSKNYKKSVLILDGLNNLEITSLIEKIDEKMPFIYGFLFHSLRNRNYPVIHLATKIYDIVFGIQQI